MSIYGLLFPPLNNDFEIQPHKCTGIILPLVNYLLLGEETLFQLAIPDWDDFIAFTFLFHHRCWNTEDVQTTRTSTSVSSGRFPEM